MPTLAIILTLALQGAVATPARDPVAELLRQRIEAGSVAGRLTARGEAIHAFEAVSRFYAERAFAPAWSEGLRSLPRADSVASALADAPLEGLDGGHYHLAAVRELLDDARRSGSDAEAVADAELLLTDAFLLYGTHLASGRTDPRVVDPEWRTVLRGADVEGMLRGAILHDDPAAALRRLRPTAPEYHRLRDVLARLEGVAARGGWAPVPDGPTLRPGDRGARVAALRARLAWERAVSTGAPDPSGPEPELFDAELEAAVRDFQSRHGLGPDGVVGDMTAAALAVPVAHRISQVRVNLERWRWLPSDLGDRHVRVNVAGFTAEAFEGGRPVLGMRAVVGMDARESPIFSSPMSYVVFAPYWNLPPHIAAVDKLPKIRQDPAWLAAQGMAVLDAATGRRVDPSTVDWSGMGGGEFNRRFLLRQDPGPLNALGDVKFMFPNRYNVYLHDTPERWLFDRAVRTFSSGCIRIERPRELVRWLLGEEWTDQRIRETVALRRETRVDLLTPVPVHILYLTAVVDGEGRAHLLGDPYERDGAVVAALDAEPPGG